MRLISSLLLAFVGTIAGCRTPTDSGSRACEQTYEFGNTGCFEVAGQVVGSAGQALRAIAVSLRSPTGPSSDFNSNYQMTDSAGQFRIRLSRMAGNPPAGGAPDTASVYVIAADLSTAGLYMPASIQDSVLALVTLAPVGTIPEPVVVRITLGKP